MKVKFNFLSLIFVIFLLIIVTSVAHATTYYVSTSGNDGAGHTGLNGDPWRTIHYALTQIGDNSILNVSAGTYGEYPLEITQNNLSIIGSGSSSTVIQDTITMVTNSTYPLDSYIRIIGAGVTFQGFTIQGNATNGTVSYTYPQASPNEPFYGILIRGINAPTSSIQNLTSISDVAVEFFGKSGIKVSGGNDLTLNHITSINNAGAGIYLIDSRNITLSNITTNNNNWGGLGIATLGEGWNPVDTAIIINGTNSFGESSAGVGMYIEEGNYNDPSHPVNITFGASNTSTYNVNFSLTDFSYALSGPQDDNFNRIAFSDSITQVLRAAVHPALGHFQSSGRLIHDLNLPYNSWTGKTYTNAIISLPPGNSTVYTNTPILSWYLSTYIPGPVSYNVLIRKSTNGNYSGSYPDFIKLNGVNSTSVNVPDSVKLAAGQKYYFIVETNLGNSLFSVSNEESFTIDNSQGGAPIPVPSWPSGNATIYSVFPTLFWYLSSAASGTLKYDIIIRDSTTHTLFYNALNVSSTMYDVSLTGTPLTGGDTYAWQVRSHNITSGDSSNYSAFATFTVDQSQGGAPVPVASWPIDSTTVYSSTPTLNWYLISPASGTLSYDIIIRDTTTHTLFYNALNVSSSYYNISLTGSPLTAGDTYVWQVRSKNGSAVSSYSANAFFVVDKGQTNVPLPILSWPVGNATEYTNTPFLTWYLNGSVAGTLQYDLIIRDSTTQTLFYSALNLSSTWFDVSSIGTPLTAGHTYSWQVRTHNITTSQYSNYSSFETFTIYSNQSGNPTPIISWPTGSSTEYTSKPTFFWYNNGIASGTITYTIEIKPTSVPFDSTANPILQSGISGTMYTLVTSLTPGTSYHWRVMLTSSSAGNSNWSSAGNFSTNSILGSFTAPLAGDPINGVRISHPFATLSWYLPTAPSEIQTYQLEVSSNPDMSNPLIQLANIPSTNKLIPNLSDGNYYWRVIAQTSNGKLSDYSNIGYFNVYNVTDVNGNINNIPKTFVVNQNYPNPFNPSTTIKYELPQALFVTIKIYNILGQEVKTLVNGDRSAGIYSTQWNGDNNFGQQVASGTYIYRVIAGSNTVVKKMLLLK